MAPGEKQFAQDLGAAKTETQGVGIRSTPSAGCITASEGGLGHMLPHTEVWL